MAVWYHGGAFMGGYGSEIEFDGRAYAKRGVILVSVDYRCNIFGYHSRYERNAADLSAYC